MANASKGSKISLGERENVSRRITKAARTEYMASSERLMNQLLAFRKGKKVMVTIENPNKEEKNKRFIRVPGSNYWKNVDIKSFI